MIRKQSSFEVGKATRCLTALQAHKNRNRITTGLRKCMGSQRYVTDNQKFMQEANAPYSQRRVVLNEDGFQSF
jgi:hypothetical protein